MQAAGMHRPRGMEMQLRFRSMKSRASCGNKGRRGKSATFVDQSWLQF